MFQKERYIFEAEAGQSIYLFAEELIKEQRKQTNLDIIGIFNGIKLNVNGDETPTSLFWQYNYKDLKRKIDK